MLHARRSTLAGLTCAGALLTASITETAVAQSGKTTKISNCSQIKGTIFASSPNRDVRVIQRRKDLRTVVCRRTGYRKAQVREIDPFGATSYAVHGGRYISAQTELSDRTGNDRDLGAWLFDAVTGKVLISDLAPLATYTDGGGAVMLRSASAGWQLLAVDGAGIRVLATVSEIGQITDLTSTGNTVYWTNAAGVAQRTVLTGPAAPGAVTSETP